MLPTVFDRLSGNEVKLLLYLMSFDNGSNNGLIPLSARQAAKGIGTDPKTANACLHGLDRAGFIRPNEHGFFAVKGGPATTWRLTFLPAFGKAATHEWREPPAEQISWWEKFPATVGKITTAAKKQASTVGKITTAPNGKLPNPEKPLVGDITTQTVATVEGAGLGRIRVETEAGNTSGQIEQSEPIRRQVKTVWMGLGMSARRSLARSCGLSPVELAEYVSGNRALTIGKQMALRSAASQAA
jgi:hypothetical protein